MQISAFYGHLPVVRYLVEDADVNPHRSVPINGNAADLASIDGHEKVFCYLLRKGIRPVFPRLCGLRLAALGKLKAIKILCKIYTFELIIKEDENDIYING